MLQHYHDHSLLTSAAKMLLWIISLFSNLLSSVNVLNCFVFTLMAFALLEVCDIA